MTHVTTTGPQAPSTSGSDSDTMNSTESTNRTDATDAADGREATILVDEVGALAAEQVTTILTEKPDDAWATLVQGGWHLLGSDPEDGADLRGIQEVSRAAGRHAVATPLITTLLAGRWAAQADSDLELDGGVTLLVDTGARLVAPFAGTTGDLLVLDGSLRSVSFDQVGEPDASLSLVVPVAEVAVAAETDAVSGRYRAELLSALAAAAVGCADEVLDRSAQWVQTREQFGQPISRFQAVRHHLADMHVNRELAWTAALAAGREPEHAETWARQACDLATGCIETGIQVHGGVGFTWEVGLQHFLTYVMQVRELLPDGRDENPSAVAGSPA